MKSRSLLPKSRPVCRPKSRRGITIAEMMIAASLLVVSISGTVSIVGMAGRAEVAIRLQSDVDRGCTTAMQRIIQDVREAKEVQVLAPHQFRIFYPVRRPEGYYDRSQTNFDAYVEYVRADASGAPDAQGGFLRRKTNAGASEVVAKDVEAMLVRTDTGESVRVALTLGKTERQKSYEAKLDERVIYLRNH
jgi:hypothetical protein